jgi:hypothetical protein
MPVRAELFRKLRRFKMHYYLWRFKMRYYLWTVVFVASLITGTILLLNPTWGMHKGRPLFFVHVMILPLLSMLSLCVGRKDDSR